MQGAYFVWMFRTCETFGGWTHMLQIFLVNRDMLESIKFGKILESNWGLYSQCSPPTNIFFSFKCWTVALRLFFLVAKSSWIWGTLPNLELSLLKYLPTLVKFLWHHTSGEKATNDPHKHGFSIGISSKTSKFTVVNYDSIFPKKCSWFSLMIAVFQPDIYSSLAR